MNKVKINGEGLKEFEIDFIEPLYQTRKKLSVLIHKLRTPKYTDESGHLFFCYDIAKEITGLTDEQLNVYTDSQIMGISLKAIDYLSKKK